MGSLGFCHLHDIDLMVLLLAATALLIALPITTLTTPWDRFPMANRLSLLLDDGASSKLKPGTCYGGYGGGASD